jgi:hypothetical protein
VGATIDHVVCECVIALTSDGYIGVGVNSANLIAEVHDSYTCPKTTVADMLICLVKTTVQTYAWHSLQLG